MASSEKIVSPGVFTNEIDESFLPATVGDIGAVVVGPTVKGPPNEPIVVSSFSEFEGTFGSTFEYPTNGLSGMVYFSKLCAFELYLILLKLPPSLNECGSNQDHATDSCVLPF